METIYKSYKFRLYPTKEQEVLLLKHFGCNRFIWNYFLNNRKEQYLKDKTSLSYYDNAKTLTGLKKQDEYNWLKEVNSQTLQSSIRNLDHSYKRFFNKVSNFPKFKSKNNKQSFHIPQNISIENNKLKILKFKKGIKVKQHQKVKGKICNATISKTPTDKYYVSITCEIEHKPLPKNNLEVGIDTGIKDLAILSDGTKYENKRILKKYLKELKYEQRQLSKKTKGSKSRDKQRKKVTRIHEKITNIRNDYLHKVSIDIIKNHNVICVEDLNIKDMMKNKHLSQSLSDVALGTFYQMLEYKSKWNNRTFIKINRYFPSSKTCSKCGWIKQDLQLKHREWMCESCGENHDRDINASKNILKQGLNILSGCGIQSDIKQK